MARLCRYGDLLSAATLLGATETDPVVCNKPAVYAALIATDTDGFVIEITTPVCPVHDAHVSQSPGYRRSIKLRERAAT